MVKYTNHELLRRITLTALISTNEKKFMESSLPKQISELVKVVDPQNVVDLAIECRFEQGLRIVPLVLLYYVSKHSPNFPLKDHLAKVCTRPDMMISMLEILKADKGKLIPIPKWIKKGLAKAFDNFGEYQIAKYKKSNNELSLVDVANLVHPVPTDKNRDALAGLIKGTLKAPDTWEVALSSGASKKDTFERLIEEGKLGALATLRNIRNMSESGVPLQTIIKGIDGVNSSWLKPLDFFAAARINKDLISPLSGAMKRSFSKVKIPGKTILAVDVSGSMGHLSCGTSTHSRMDLAVSLAAIAPYIFEDLVLIFTAGSDMERKGKHIIWEKSSGLNLLDDIGNIVNSLGCGGIFTRQLCDWLNKSQLNGDRLVVISDSQDIDYHYGDKTKPDVSRFKSSYIIDISHESVGIKTDVWTAELSGWSDSMFRYIAAIECVKNLEEIIDI